MNEASPKPMKGNQSNPVSSSSTDNNHKGILDSLLLNIPGVTAGDMTGLDAYFVNQRMFSCICNRGVGIRLSATQAANLQISMGALFLFSQGD